MAATFDSTDAPLLQVPSGPGLTIVEEGSADFPWLIERLANNVGFSSLSLGSANLSTDDLVAVAQALEVNTTLESLDLEGNSIDEVALSAFAEAIAANKSLRELKLGTHSASKDTEEKLAAAMEENYSLSVLAIDIHDDTSRASIQESLARNASIEYTRRTSSSSRNGRTSKRSIGRKPSDPINPTPEEIQKIVQELTVEQKEQLAEKIAELDAEQLQALFDLIRESMPELPEDEEVELDLEGLKYETLWAMLEFVNAVLEQEDEQLELEEDGFEVVDDESGFIELSQEGDDGEFEQDEGMGDESTIGLDVSWLVEQLKENAGIMSLQLNDAMLVTQNIVDVAEALHENTMLESLNLEGNEIDTEGILAISKLIAVNKTLKELKIGTQSIPVGIDAEKALAKSMSANYKLTTLALSIEDPSSRTIIEKCLERNNSGFIPPRTDASPLPDAHDSPMVKRKSSIENWKNVKNMIWKLESDGAPVGERRRTKVSVVRGGGGKVVLEETVVVEPIKSDLRSTLTKLDQMLDAYNEEDGTSDMKQTSAPTPTVSTVETILIPDHSIAVTSAAVEDSTAAVTTPSISEASYNSPEIFSVEVVSAAVALEHAGISALPPANDSSPTDMTTTSIASNTTLVDSFPKERHDSGAALESTLLDRKSRGIRAFGTATDVILEERVAEDDVEIEIDKEKESPTAARVDILARASSPIYSRTTVTSSSRKPSKRVSFAEPDLTAILASTASLSPIVRDSSKTKTSLIFETVDPVIVTPDSTLVSPEVNNAQTLSFTTQAGVFILLCLSTMFLPLSVLLFVRLLFLLGNSPSHQNVQVLKT